MKCGWLYKPDTGKVVSVREPLLLRSNQTQSEVKLFVVEGETIYTNVVL